ncbi:hypothetical protein Tco_1557260 [Tanacetum coccineum]
MRRVDEAVHKELGDSLVRAATTASSLEAEQDSGGGPGAKKPWGILLLKLGLRVYQNIPMIHYSQEVLDLEKTKTTQHNEIASLKRRVKKLEKKDSLGEDASKQGRIDAIDADEEITLVSVHDVNVSAGEEVFVVEQEVVDEMEVVKEVVKVINTAKLIIDAAQVSVVGDIVSAASATTTVSAATTTTATIKIVNDITLAQALEEIKSTKPKKKEVFIQELGESTTTISSELSSQQS